MPPPIRPADSWLPPCLDPGTIRILPNNVIHETPYRFEVRTTKDAPNECTGGCGPEDTCGKKIRLNNTSPLQRINARYDFMTTRPPGPGCKMPGEILILPNNPIHDTPYRYETRPLQEPMPRAGPPSDFKVAYDNAIFRSNYRYEYAQPRTALGRAVALAEQSEALRQCIRCPGCNYKR